MTVEVRRIGPGDCPALTDLFAAIAVDGPTLAFFRPHLFDEATARRISMRDGIVDDEYFGVFDGPEMVGYGMLRGWDEGYEVPAFGVCVRPGERGRGVGRALLSFALDLARDKGAPEVMLKVHDGNSAARSLYEGFGFTFCERTPDGLQLLGRLRLPGSGS